MTLRVQAGDLGEVAVTLNRDANGVRVSIDTVESRAIAAMKAERGVLVRALQAIGVRVQSVTFGTGTGLAGVRVEAHERSQEVPDRYSRSTPSKDGRARSKRRLDVVG